MRVTLDNGVTVTVPSEELVRPVRGLGQDGKPKINTNYTEVAIYEGGAAEDAVVLGKAFLSTVSSALHQPGGVADAGTPALSVCRPREYEIQTRQAELWRRGASYQVVSALSHEAQSGHHGQGFDRRDIGARRDSAFARSICVLQIRTRRTGKQGYWSATEK